MGTRYLSWVILTAVMGGLLFGLNMAGISGAVDGIKADFALTDSGLGTVASLLTIGCLIGALFTGSFTEKYGRKKVMVTTAVLYIVSVVQVYYFVGLVFQGAYIGRIDNQRVKFIFFDNRFFVQNVP